MEVRHMKTLFDEVSSQFLQCSTCQKLFNDKKRVPRFFPCSHTICQDCMTRQFTKSVNDECMILCQICCKVLLAHSHVVNDYEKNNDLRKLKEFVSDKRKKELCNKCTNQFSDAYCTVCDLSLCISCNETIHIDNNSSHNIKFLVKKQNPSFDACHLCEKQSNIYCITCKKFMCYTCRHSNHRDSSVGTHKVIMVNESNVTGIEMDDSSLQTIGTNRMEASPMNIFLDNLSREFLECCICKTSFDDSVRVPMYYPCMHTTCKDCMKCQFQKITGKRVLRCPLCMRDYNEGCFSVKENTIIRDLNTYVLTKKEKGFCDHCPAQLSDVYCLECDSNLCKSCNETIHAGNNSCHNVITGIKKQDLPKDTCLKCLQQSDIYCQTCKVFLCDNCMDLYHSNESFKTHKFLRIHELTALVLDNDNVENKPELENRNTVQGMRNRNNVQGMGNRNNVQGMGNRSNCLLQLVAIAVAMFAGLILVALALLGHPVSSAPAYISVPSEEVEPVHMLCSHQTKMEEYPYMAETKTRVVRTLCTFNVFHYDLRNRRRTYFVIDIDIDISETYKKSRLGKLFTIKTIPDKMQDTPDIYWTVYRCETNVQTMALCLNKRDFPGLARVISEVSIGETRIVSFLFLVDNDKKVMEIFSPAVLWSDEVSLDNYNNEDQPLSIWILLAEYKHDKYINARIRSGADVTIHDLSKTNIEIILDFLVYPFTYLYRFLKEKLPPSRTQVEL